MDIADTNKPEVWWQTGRASEAMDESLKHWKPGHGTDTNNPKKVPKDLRHLPTDMTNEHRGICARKELPSKSDCETGGRGTGDTATVQTKSPVSSIDSSPSRPSRASLVSRRVKCLLHSALSKECVCV